MAAYTLLQLFEVALAAGVVLYGVLARSPAVVLVGAGFLIGKAILNVLAPEGGSVYRRSLIGYAIGGLFVLGGLLAAHFAG
ncbi:MAG TPA: hypothetical protein VEU76_00975 [Candidatus Udaeobacter sp.]|nr:hypothetical protein [Candidatus Udaeobacter sp.]